MMCVWQEKAAKLKKIDSQGNIDPAKAQAAFETDTAWGRSPPSDAEATPHTAMAKCARHGELTNAIQSFFLEHSRWVSRDLPRGCCTDMRERRHEFPRTDRVGATSIRNWLKWLFRDDAYEAAPADASGLTPWWTCADPR